MTEVLTVGALGSTLMRRWKLIAVLAVLGAVAGTAYGVVSPKAYTAEATLIVYAASSDNSGIYQAAQFAEKRAATYPVLVTAPEVVDATRETLDLPYSSTALLAMVTATNPTDTPQVKVAATSEFPAEAKEIADSIADNIAEYAIELEKSGARNTSVTIQKAVPAREPTSPTSPSPSILGALGFLAGGAGGVLLALLLRSLPSRRRDHVRSGDEGGLAPRPAAGPSTGASGSSSTAASSRWTLTPRREARTPPPATEVPTPDGSDQRDPGSDDGSDDDADDSDDDGTAAREDARRGPRAARRPATTVGRPTVRMAKSSSLARDGARSATRSR